jgi:carboxyl-terminal processing protease
VLVDQETASAAEVLAGALKERAGRAPTVLLGQPTYGKGSVQCVVPLTEAPMDRLSGGIRLTVARLFSPSNQPYTRRGVTPHVAFDTNAEAELLAKARELLQGLIKPPAPMTVASASPMM